MDIYKGKKEKNRGGEAHHSEKRYSEGDEVDESFFIKIINNNDSDINNFNKFAEKESVERDPDIENEIVKIEEESQQQMLFDRINEVNSLTEEADEEELLMRHLEEEGISFTPDDNDLDFEFNTIESNNVSNDDTIVENDNKNDRINPEDLEKFLKNNKGLLDFDD